MSPRRLLPIAAFLLGLPLAAIAAVADPPDTPTPGGAGGGGMRRVLVHLNVATAPEGALPHGLAVAAQRSAIGAAQAAVRSALAGRGHRLLWEYGAIPFVAAEVNQDALTALQTSPVVSGIYEDKLHRLSLQQSVPLIHADQAWAQGFDGTGILVAILDTGVDKSHPFLLNKVIEEAAIREAATARTVRRPSSEPARGCHAPTPEGAPTGRTSPASPRERGPLSGG